MGTGLREFFIINRPLVFFVYGLVFFVLGLAISLQSRRHSRLTLARHLPWLALFGFIHSLHEWGDVFIPIQATYLPPPFINLLKAVQLGLLSLSFACLFQFGVNLLRPMPPRWTWLRWLPAGVLLLWSLAAMIWLTAEPVSLAEWYLLGNIWTRYLIGFPGAALAAYGLRRQATQLIAPFREPQILQMLYLAGLALAGYAVVGGLIAPPGPYFPANWLNTALLESWLSIPIPIFRSLLGLTLTVAIIRTLEIFDLEIDRRLSSMEEAQILATEREHLGRDLHDHTLQSVYAAGLMLNAARRTPCLMADDAAAENLAQAAQTLDRAVTDIRQHIAELRAQPGRLNLAEGVTQLLQESALSSLVQVELKLDLPENRPLTTRQVRHLLAITGEALSNVARHAQARRVQLSIGASEETLSLSIADDGHGIPPDFVAGYGLRNMRDRARLLAGDLNIESRPGHGTRLQLTMPYDQGVDGEENNNFNS
ncbi:MAG: hypothetical protein DPW09_18620 [Anaerolineae bacterium]|nr:hypothetical protein [Anaerolineales bacterium]MCQ3975460.1 hypothetical protein [Anaerolineae bacterium]